uniref:Post-GPI attachment to proteins GalNAc transferase 4 n=1 Tax=Cyprinus carpio TaxID=7962 RepID=A0A8C2E3W9_CYPCA
YFLNCDHSSNKGLKHFRWSSPVAQELLLCVLTFGVILPICCHRLLILFVKDCQEALRFWEAAASMKSLKDPLETTAKKADLLVTVVTARRAEGRDCHYLLQVAQQLKSPLKACGDKPCAEVMLCDIESSPTLNEDALLLEKQFLVSRDVDDALPLSVFFPATENLLSRRFELNTLYIKLHHPERLQRYWNPEPYHILEWMGLGLFGAMMHLLLSSHCTPLSFTFSPPHFLFLALYVMAVAELAVCAQGNGDMVLYKIARSMPGEKAHSVEPNLIKHIGAYSSIRTNPVPPRLI